jgi:hypothetical protein
MTASTAARSFSGRQLRIAISRRTSVDVSEAATCASAPATAWRTVEFGSSKNRTAAPRASGMPANTRPTAKALRVSGESGADVGRKRSVLVPINELICRRRGKLWRRRDFRLMQRSPHKGKHAPVDVSGLDLCDDVGLKIRDQLACVRVAAIGAIT